MRPSHGETTSKQKVHKLKVSIIELFNPHVRIMSHDETSHTKFGKIKRLGLGLNF